MKHRKLIFRVLVYGVALYYSAVFLAYGLSWKDFKKNVTLDVLRSGGRQINGPIKSIRSYGLLGSKDYAIEVEGSPETFLIPSVLLDPYWENPAPIPIRLGQLSKGTYIFISSSGDKKPIVLQLILRGQSVKPDETLMSYEESARRYQEAYEISEQIGSTFVRRGILIFPLAVLGDLGLMAVLRKRWVRVTTARKAT